MTVRVLTVCTGNMCRSPLAERLIAQRGAAAGLDLDVTSAGTKATNGGAIHPETDRVLRSYGGDPTGFASRLLSPRVLQGQDLVVTASRRHRDAVQEMSPLLWKKAFTLAEIVRLVDLEPEVTRAGLAKVRTRIDTDDPALDIEDPIGQGPEVFDRTGREISDAVDVIVAMLAR